MCWRLQITAEAAKTTDFFLHLPEIGLVSQLELWLGLIVVCMPTLAPLVKAYVKPAITYMRSAPSSYRRGDDSVKLKEIAGEGSAPRRYYNIETNVEEGGDYTARDPAGSPGLAGAVKTDCVYDPTEEPMDGDKIRVRREIESDGV